MHDLKWLPGRKARSRPCEWSWGCPPGTWGNHRGLPVQSGRLRHPSTIPFRSTYLVLQSMIFPAQRCSVWPLRLILVQQLLTHLSSFWLPLVLRHLRSQRHLQLFSRRLHRFLSSFPLSCYQTTSPESWNRTTQPSCRRCSHFRCCCYSSRYYCCCCCSWSWKEKKRWLNFHPKVQWCWKFNFTIYLGHIRNETMFTFLKIQFLYKCISWTQETTFNSLKASVDLDLPILVIWQVQIGTSSNIILNPEKNQLKKRCCQNSWDQQTTN